MSRLLIFSVLGLAACEDGGFKIDDTGEAAGSGAVVATVSSDYATGALATVSLDDWSVSDNLATLSGDPALSVSEGKVLALSRGSEDAVRIYAPGAWTEPLVEFSVGDGANPHDAEICGDALWVSLYGESFLGVYDPDNGNLLASLDLAAYDDGDGIPEASSMVVRGDTLYVALEQLDETTTYWSAKGGTVIAIDCMRRSISGSWEVSPVPTLFADPDDEQGLLVRTGAYFDAEGEFSWDGGLWSLDPAEGTVSAIAPAESENNLNYTGIAAAEGGRAIVVATDASWLYSVYCLDRSSGSLTLIETLDSYISSVQVNARGEAWLATRASWAAPDAAAGVLVYDVASCTRLTDAPIALSLEPYAIAFY